MYVDLDFMLFSLFLLYSGWGVIQDQDWGSFDFLFSFFFSFLFVTAGIHCFCLLPFYHPNTEVYFFFLSLHLT